MKESYANMNEDLEKKYRALESKLKADFCDRGLPMILKASPGGRALRLLLTSSSCFITCSANPYRVRNWDDRMITSVRSPNLFPGCV